MKIEIEVEGVKCSVESVDGITLDECLVLMEQALKGVGFSFDGHLTIEPLDDHLE